MSKIGTALHSIGLYRPLMKTFRYITDYQYLRNELEIQMDIRRQGKTVCSTETDLSKLKRSPRELVEYLTREAGFPSGCFLMTGTGIVPDDEFSLEPGDEVRITIEPIGTLVNVMELGPG